MEFSPRLKQILSVLLNENGVISITQLAVAIHVSKRTVQRELEYVDGVLKKYDLELKSKTGKGIWLEGSTEGKEKLLRQLEQNKMMNSGDKEERRKRLILEILKDRESKKLYYYSNILQVSEATISNDMEAVEPWFGKFGLKLLRKQGYGVSLEGGEKDYRSAISAFLEENIDRTFIKKLFQEKTPAVYDMIAREEKNIYSLLDQDILIQVILCFFSIQDARIAKLTDNSYIGLILHVAIAINRILKKEIIEPDQDLFQRLKRDGEYELAKHIVISLEEQFQIEIPDVEIAYIYLHLKGAKYQTAEIEDFGLGEPEKKEEILQLIERMIEAYDRELAFLLKQDEDFITSLMAHLQPTLIRLRNHMVISNPLLDEIQDKYPLIYRKCERMAEVLGAYCGSPVPEPEIGFLVMHFGAALVRLESSKEDQRKVYIGIVCASGIGVSRLMLTKLRRFFKDRAQLMTFGKEDINEEVQKEMDFFVATLSLEAPEIDVIMVNPLLTERDLECIDEKVREYARRPGKQIPLTQFSDRLEEVNYLAREIKHMLGEFLCVKVDGNIGFEELIVAAAETLSPYKEKHILITKDLLQRESIASQIVPEYGFALLHTRTGGVVHPSFSVFLPKDGEMFRDPYFKRIFAVVIMLMPKDDHVNENKQILGYLSSRLVENEKFLTVIFNSDEAAIKEALTAELHQFFNRYLDSIQE